MSALRLVIGLAQGRRGGVVGIRYGYVFLFGQRVASGRIGARCVENSTYPTAEDVRLAQKGGGAGLQLST